MRQECITQFVELHNWGGIFCSICIYLPQSDFYTSGTVSFDLLYKIVYSVCRYYDSRTGKNCQTGIFRRQDGTKWTETEPNGTKWTDFPADLIVS